MIQKYFPFDKNYILEKAQFDQEERLIVYLINFVKAYYQVNANPLGLEDDTTIAIKNHATEYTDRLTEFYRHLAGIYRFKHGQNQLELLFDGQDHYQKYVEDWKIKYKEWLHEFCAKPNFVKAVLELTVFFPEGKKSFLAESRMKTFIQQHFDLKVYKYKGIVQMKIA
ncbi:hypothetical protein FNH22_25780 [Fulvivirga sp. M361]|uniref:hypothetical protein n=1 Tax=Fulvivirga sp. M361 TaxID=2594266 RepID=UPI001179C2D2|nr:hypothetical protein [Fulvivirga sp. M361]TRX50453.1 hypothetical protein FNH22_25780 [Fulvivirga sp. M361]